jgi:hypothetical protein
MLSSIDHLYTPCHDNNGLQLPNLQLEWWLVVNYDVTKLLKFEFFEFKNNSFILFFFFMTHLHILESLKTKMNERDMAPWN